MRDRVEQSLSLLRHANQGSGPVQDPSQPAANQRKRKTTVDQLPPLTQNVRTECSLFQVTEFWSGLLFRNS